jgi:hypothetical protein
VAADSQLSLQKLPCRTQAAVIVIVNAGFAERFRDREPASPDFVRVDREPPAAVIVIESTRRNTDLLFGLPDCASVLAAIQAMRLRRARCARSLDSGSARCRGAGYARNHAGSRGPPTSHYKSLN